MQLPIMAANTVEDGKFVASYPINLEPESLNNGISAGQLITTRGTLPFGTGPGKCRGGINWDGTCYLVMGSKLVSVSSDGVVTVLADVGNDASPVRLDYGFGRLAINSSKRLYYWTGTALEDVTDPDIGVVLDVVWIDGYYATTDGTYIIVTDLTDPTSVNPLRYGSAEQDPDAITGVMKLNEQLYAVGRNTIQVMQNVGGTGFPFSIVQGATIQSGCVSASAKCMVGQDGFAYVGSARNEPLAIWYFNGSTIARISDDQIDSLLEKEANPELIEMECRAFPNERKLIVHLLGKSLTLSLSTSAEANQQAWSILHSGNFGPYRIRHDVYCYGKHIVSDLHSGEIGYLDDATATHFGERTDWRFDSSTLFAPGGMTASEVELFGVFPTEENAIWLSITRDGVKWSKEVARRLTGRRDERVVWRPNVPFNRMGAFRWRGRDKVSIARCEVM